MVKRTKDKGEKNKNDPKAAKKTSRQYVREYMAMRRAIVENCKDCIRDCGGDCLDSEANPIEKLRCPLQEVRIIYNISISHENYRTPRWKVVKNEGLEL